MTDHWSTEKWLTHLESFSEHGTTNARAVARRVRALLVAPTPEAVERVAYREALLKRLVSEFGWSEVEAQEFMTDVELDATAALAALRGEG